MAKPREKTGSSAPPPLSQHLRELASRRDAWLVLARNLIPVVGIYGFGWSAALAVFNYWFDGLTALAAIVAALIPRALRETQAKSVGAAWPMNLVRGVVTWIFLVGIVGLPYWIVLIPLHDLLLGNELRRQRELGSCRTNFPPFLLEPRRVSKGFACLGRQFPIARKALQHLGWDNEAREHAAMEKARHRVRSVVQVQVSSCFHCSSFGSLLYLMGVCESRLTRCGENVANLELAKNDVEIGSVRDIAIKTAASKRAEEKK